MLDKMYRRKDVCDFIEELFSDTYNEKKQEASINYYGSISKEQVLFTFLDALFKYQIIIDTDIFLDEYIIQVRKLFKKLDDFQDINLGISKIIGKFLALKLNIVDREDPVEKRKILEYVYNRYIVEGYFFHGFSGVYKEQIKRYGFVPEEYQHSYSKFIEVDKIFSKHRIESVMEKNFHAKYVTFTDNFMMGCFYGVNAPMYFYKLLGGGIKDKDNQANAYFNNDYLGCFNNLNRLIKKAGLNATEKKYVIKVCFDEWKVLQKSSSNINIMLIKRKILGLNCLNCINDILNSDSDLGEGIWKILSSKSDNIPIGHKIEANDLEFIEVPNYKVIFALREKQAYETKNMKILESNKERINNAYGKASILVLLGSLFITMGVILSIIKIIGGM